MDTSRLEGKITLPVLIIFICLPFILVKFIQPIWIGRLLAIGLFHIPIVVFCFIFSFHKKIFKHINEKKFKTPESARSALNKINIIARILFILFAIMWIIFGMPNYFRSISYMLAGNEPASYIGSLTYRGGSVAPFSNFVHESLGFDKETKTNHFFHLYFSFPLNMGKKYEFKYIPTTRLILEIKEVP